MTDDERKPYRAVEKNGAWSVVRFSDYYFASDDSHNVISIGVCPKDGTIHMAFDHHGSSLC